MQRESHDLAGVVTAAYAGGAIGFAAAFVVVLVVSLLFGASGTMALLAAVFSALWGGGIIGATVGASRRFAMARS
jgi:hypothetical protein